MANRANKIKWKKLKILILIHNDIIAIVKCAVHNF